MISRKAVSLIAAGLFATSPLAAQEATPPAVPPVQLRDGSHDFDFERGAWALHIRRLVHPLTGSTQWTDYDGAKTDTPIWGGKANLAEVNAEGRAGHLQFLALRLYSPAAHQWGLYFASANSGVFGTPLVGAFRNGRAEFVGPDVYNGRSILVRFVMQSDGPGKASSEQYFSADGGHSWELNWINTYTRTNTPSSASAQSPNAATNHDFDFALGTFHTRIKRLQNPLTGSTTWVGYQGTKADVPILGGNVSLETIEADGPSHLELMTLRLYNPAGHQWSLNFSSSDSGEMSTPAIGEFRHGIGTFTDQEDYNGRTILVRQLWSNITASSYHFEQAFSADHGKTWEPNFVADLTRRPPSL
jgi:hypothetical protein